MGHYAFIIAGMFMGPILGFFHGIHSRKQLLLCSLLGGIVGLGVMLFILLASYIIVPIPTK